MRITIQTHLCNLRCSFLSLVFMLILMLFDMARGEFTVSQFYILGIAGLVLNLPAAFLHLEYYFLNRRKVYVVNKDELVCISGNDKLSIAKSSIKFVYLYLSSNLYARSSIRMTPFDEYYFALIETHTGERLYMTSLISCDLESEISKLGITVTRRKLIICTTHWNAIKKVLLS